MADDICAQLDALYEQVPEVGCKGLCADACGPIKMGPLERLRTRRAGVRITPHQQAVRELRESDGEWFCDALKHGRCAVYQDRPMICRLWGVSEGLECPYGCRPTRTLPRAEAFALLDAAQKAGTIERPITKEQAEAAMEKPRFKAYEAVVLRKPTRDRKTSRRLREQ